MKQQALEDAIVKLSQVMRELTGLSMMLEHKFDEDIRAIQVKLDELLERIAEEEMED